MKKLFTAALAATFLAGSVIGAAIADPGQGKGHDNAKTHASGAVRAHAEVRPNQTLRRAPVRMYHNSMARPYTRTYGNTSAGNSATAHNCANPSGHTRGWCKGNGVYRGRSGSNQTITGTILSVGNGTVTLIGLPPRTINVQRAINNGATNGSLSIGRSITAYGYYSGGTFYATAIR
ncbi:MAG: hypothetical protein M3Y18_09115 [Candidatus Eremiobacteraeota bacterium]|nr:hypothetical protein [Candidatus Eremiobacteraeota bacterium]